MKLRISLLNKKSLISPLSSMKELPSLPLFFETLSSHRPKSTSTYAYFMVSNFFVAAVIIK